MTILSAIIASDIAVQGDITYTSGVLQMTQNSVHNVAKLANFCYYTSTTVLDGFTTNHKSYDITKTLELVNVCASNGNVKSIDMSVDMTESVQHVTVGFHVVMDTTDLYVDFHGTMTYTK
jgi:hypothetical protein